MVEEVRREGRTVFLSSHVMPEVERAVRPGRRSSARVAWSRSRTSATSGQGAQVRMLEIRLRRAAAARPVRRHGPACSDVAVANGDTHPRHGGRSDRRASSRRRLASRSWICKSHEPAPRGHLPDLLREGGRPWRMRRRSARSDAPYGLLQDAAGPAQGRSPGGRRARRRCDPHCTARSGRASATTRRSSTSTCANAPGTSSRTSSARSTTRPPRGTCSPSCSRSSPRSLLIVYGIGAGARAVAGEEEAGSLDLLLSVARSGGGASSSTSSLAMLGATFLPRRSSCGSRSWRSARCSSLRVGLGGRSTAMSLNTFLLGMVFGSLALAVGSATGRRSVAIGVRRVASRSRRSS